MKQHTAHTVKIDTGRSIAVQAMKPGASGVRVSLSVFGADMASAVLTLNHCAGLILALQIASEESQQQQAGASHIVKIDTGRSIAVQAMKPGASGVRVSLSVFGADMASAVLTLNHCAGLILALQIASEQSQQQQVGV